MPGPLSNKERLWLRDEMESHISKNGYSSIVLDHLAYTAGLYRSYGHPEVCVLGLDEERGVGLLQLIAERVKGSVPPGNPPIRPGDRMDKILQTLDVSFVEVSASMRDQWLPATSIVLYENQPYPVLQCIYPDEDGLFPGEGCAEEVAFHQSWEGLQAFVDQVTNRQQWN